MSSEEPPTKKAKTWESHKLNISEAVMKTDETKFFSELVDAPIQTLQGIGPKADAVLEHLKIKTVKELANYKFFLMARMIKTLSEVETKGGRLPNAFLNIDLALDKKYETKTFGEVLKAPVSSLQGLSEKANDLLQELKVETVEDLADFKYARWAEAIVEAAKYEEHKTDEERKKEREMNKLA